MASPGRRWDLRPSLDLAPWGKAYSACMSREGLLIGEVARRSGLSRKALRLYEARGVLPSPRRTRSGYRMYPPEILGILAFVQQGRRLGLTLTELRDIVVLRRAGTTPCVHVRTLLEQKASDLAALLSAVRRTLKAWRRADGRDAAVCPHIEGRGGDVAWKGLRSRSVPCATSARRSSSTCDEVRIGEDANTVVLKKNEWNVLVDLIRSGQLPRI